MIGYWQLKKINFNNLSRINIHNISSFLDKYIWKKKSDELLLESLSWDDNKKQEIYVLDVLEKKLVSEYGFLFYLRKLLYLRKIDLLERVVENKYVFYEEVNTFYKFKLSQYRGDRTYSSQDIYHYYNNLHRGSFLDKPTLSLVFDRAIKDGDCDFLFRVINKVGNKILYLDKQVFFGTAKLFIKNSKKDELLPFFLKYYRKLKKSDALYFYEACKEYPEVNEFISYDSWQDVLDEVNELYKLTKTPNVNTFETYIYNKLSLITSCNECDFMDIRFDDDSRWRLADNIKNALLEKRSLSFIRIGDGEAYAYDSIQIEGIRDDDLNKDNKDRENAWWGQNIAKDISTVLNRHVREAIKDADILGIPSIYRIIRDMGDVNNFFGHNRAQRGLLVVLAALGAEISLKNRFFTEDRCHHLLFSKEWLESLSEHAENVLIISCWVESQLKFSTSKPITYIRISPHTKVKDVVSKEGGVFAPIFEAYPNIVTQVEKASGPGTLVLVAAGFAGKVFMSAAKRSGAVALDIGVMADYFADYKTRNVSDLL